MNAKRTAAIERVEEKVELKTKLLETLRMQVEDPIDLCARSLVCAGSTSHDAALTLRDFLADLAMDTEVSGEES